MRLSFVVLTYRRLELLRRCLESLGAPETGQWEVCVAFNGADPAGQAEIARAFPWARVFELQRCCRGEARNRAVPLSSGEIVYFLDDDTRAAPGFAGRVLAKFERYPSAPAIGGPNLAPPD